MKNCQLTRVGAVLLLAALCTGCNKLKARDQLNKGVMAFRNAQFPQAVEHFQKAVSFDPSLINARVYLATAYAQEYAPGGESPSNVRMGQQAISAFQDVLKIDPKNTDALGNIGQIYYEMKNFDKAKEYQQQLMKIEPNDPDPYYWIGVLDWLPCFKRRMQMREALKLTTPKNPANPDTLPPLPAKSREVLAKENGPLIDEGVSSLERAIQLKPDYANAMSYLNLMYREKADIEPTAKARQADLAKADALVTKALALQKAAAEKKAKSTS